MTPKKRLCYNDDGTIKHECVNCKEYTQRSVIYYYCHLTKARAHRHDEACDKFDPVIPNPKYDYK